MIVKIYIVSAQTASSDGPFGAVRTLGDPYTDKAKAEERRDNWLSRRNEDGYRAHAFIEVHWVELEDY